MTRSAVRRERMGHIKLATPVAHIWFLRTAPSKIGLFLNAPLQKLEKVIYYASYIVTDVNEENKKTVLGELEREFKSRKKIRERERIGSGDDSSKRRADFFEAGENSYRDRVFQSGSAIRQCF